MKEVLAVLVLYKCKLEDSQAFNSLCVSLECAGKILDILVYDNSPVAQYAEKKFCRKNISIDYISDPSNPGVSKAYNTAASLAKEKGKKWLLLLDQDTCFPLNAMEQYKVFIHQQEQIIGAPVLWTGTSCVSPCKFRWGRGKALKNYRIGKNSLKHRSLLNSGLIIPLDLFYKTEGYNEKIALDFSDHYFIKAVEKYAPYFCLLDILCVHDLSAQEFDKNKVHSRFIYYLLGALEYNKEKHDIRLWLTILLRTFKLSFHFHSFIFFQTWWKIFIK